MTEPSHSLKALSQRRHNCIIWLFHGVRYVEQVHLRILSVGGLQPRPIAPEFVHPIDILGRHILRLVPDCVPVHVHDGKIEEPINRLRLPGLQHDFPIQVQPVWIEQAQGARVFLYSMRGKTDSIRYLLESPYKYRRQLDHRTASAISAVFANVHAQSLAVIRAMRTLLREGLSTVGTKADCRLGSV